MTDPLKHAEHLLCRAAGLFQGPHGYRCARVETGEDKCEWLPLEDEHAAVANVILQYVTERGLEVILP